MELKLGDKVVSTYGNDLEAEVVAILPRPTPVGNTVVLQSARGNVYFSTKDGIGDSCRCEWRKKPATKTLYYLTLLDPNNAPTVWTYPDQKTREKAAAAYCSNLYWKVVDSFARTIEIEE